MTLAPIIAVNSGTSYDSFRELGVPASLLGASRWIGRCKRDRQSHKVEGKLMRGRVTGKPYTDYVIVTPEGNAYTCTEMGSNPYFVKVRCGDHWMKLERVYEGKKESKHECGARCTNATGPSCDCRCKGARHGSTC
jgi:hypothetical protein